MLEKLAAINDRYLEVEKLISSPNAMDDMKLYVQLSKEYKDLEPIIKAYKKYRDLVGNITEAKDILSNSDDAEMGRRLNQEAAKAVKYGGTTEEDAWKMVTLNPAKLLHLEERIGSMKVGKDADIVIWSDNPLSIYTKAEQTYVDGICLFDLQRDLELRQQNLKERMRIIKKMIADKNEKKQKPKKEKEKLYHCETLEP